MFMNADEVRDFLPQKEPFLFVDTIDSIEVETPDPNDKHGVVGCTIRGNFTPKKEMDLFRGHFPDQPVLPGVIQIEMMGQVSSFTLLKKFNKSELKNLSVAFAKVDNVKFRKPIFPEMHLKIICVCSKLRGKMIQHNCKIMHNDQVMSECDVWAAFSLDERVL